jgi:hypothetical protein
LYPLSWTSSSASSSHKLVSRAGFSLTGCIFDTHVFFTGRATFQSAVMQIRPQVSPSENKITMRTFGSRQTDRFCISYVLFVPIETFLTFKKTVAITT